MTTTNPIPNGARISASEDFFVGIKLTHQEAQLLIIAIEKASKTDWGQVEMKKLKEVQEKMICNFFPQSVKAQSIKVGA